MKLSQTSLWFLLLPAIVGVHADRCGACYSDFNTLKRDIESVGSKQLGVFTVCPNTVLTADGSSLGIQFKATGATYKLQCGSSGERSNNCIIEGGPRHLSPGNSALGTNSLASINMEIKGMTFRGASTSSVFVQPTSTGDYTFRDCLWEENTSSSGAGAVHFTNAITSNDVTFTNCFFVVSLSVMLLSRRSTLEVEDSMLLTRFVQFTLLRISTEEQRQAWCHLLSC